MMDTNMLYQLADLLRDAADKRIENIQLKEKIKQLEKRNEELIELFNASNKICNELLLKYTD